MSKLFIDPLAVGHNAPSQAVKENNDIQLRCKIVGIPCPAPEIKWYFGSRLLGRWSALSI